VYSGPCSQIPRLPDNGRYWLKKGRVPLCLLADPAPDLVARADRDGLVHADIRVEEGRVRAVVPAGTAPCCGPGLHLDGGMVWPCPVDLHTHLDKAHLWPRAENPDGTFDSALATVRADAVLWNADDLEARMDFAVRAAYAHGTRAIRTHLDSGGGQAGISWGVFRRLRQRWAGRIELQAAALATPDVWLTGEGEALADRVAEVGGVYGGITFPHPALKTALVRAFTLAAERGLDLDFHVDESLSPDVHGLRLVAETAIATGFQGRTVCGHACALAVQSDSEVEATLAVVKEAGMTVVSLPMCNLYLQDRGAGRTPRRRGVTLMHEMRAAGIPIAVASDNVRDPFHGYGDLDMVETYTQAVRIAHLDRPHGDWPPCATTVPAMAMKLAWDGRISSGCPADLVLFRARFYSELLSRPQADRMVLRDGRLVDTRLPDYRELDGPLG